MKRILSLIGVVLVVGCGSEPPDGPYEEYHDNGQLFEKLTYKDVDLDGPYERYWGNGQLDRKTTYKDGVQDGLREEYYENGQLREKGTFKDDGKCGEWFERGETVTYDPC